MKGEVLQWTAGRTTGHTHMQKKRQTDRQDRLTDRQFEAESSRQNSLFSLVV
jgi:hypothetical protein